MTMQLLDPLIDSAGFAPASTDASDLRRAFGRFPSGVAALGAVVDGVKTGMVASSFSVGISFDPPMVMFSAQNSSSTWPVLRTSPRIGISILGDGHAEACYQLASRHGDRFAGLGTLERAGGALFVTDSALLLECEIVAETPAGDHSVILLEVKSLKVDADRPPLIYHGSKMRQLTP